MVDYSALMRHPDAIKIPSTPSTQNHWNQAGEGRQLSGDTPAEDLSN